MGDLPEPVEDRSLGAGGGSGTGASGGTSAGKGSGGGSSGAGSGSCDPCDCDGDGVQSEQCQGEDCNDRDANVKPGQTAYFLDESPNHGFDYDCSTFLEYEKDVGLACSALDCDESHQAFLGNPQCGTMAPWGRCVLVTAVLCEPTTISDQPVKCH